jgi:hypothetical protein
MSSIGERRRRGGGSMEQLVNDVQRRGGGGSQLPELDVMADFGSRAQPSL